MYPCLFDLRMMNMSSECEYDWYWKISACSTEYEDCDSFALLTRQQTSYSGSTGWYFRYQSIHIQITYTNKAAAEPRVPNGYVEDIISTVLRSPSWLGWPLRTISVTNEHVHVLLILSTYRFFPHSWLITGFVTTITIIFWLCCPV